MTKDQLNREARGLLQILKSSRITTEFCSNPLNTNKAVWNNIHLSKILGGEMKGDQCTLIVLIDDINRFLSSKNK